MWEGNRLAYDMTNKYTDIIFFFKNVHFHIVCSNFVWVLGMLSYVANTLVFEDKIPWAWGITDKETKRDALLCEI